MRIASLNRSAAAVVSLIALGVCLAAAGSPAMARDGLRPDQVSQSPAASTPDPLSGMIVGRVLETGTAKPLAGVTVAISREGAPGGRAMAAGQSFQSQSLVTNGAGQFVFAGLPKGDFRIAASTVGFVTHPAFADDVRPSADSAVVHLGAGERVTDTELRLTRAAAITGQLVDERGEGLEGITVSLVRVETSGGQRRSTASRSTTTDDRGVYRFGALPPGAYAICALFTRHMVPIVTTLAAMQDDRRQDIGRNLGASGSPQTSGSGYRIGDVVLISSSGSRNVDPGPDEQGHFSVFADACYPAATSIVTADAIHVESGEERGQVDLTLRVVPTVKVSGALIGPPERLGGMAVNLYPHVSADASISAPMLAQTVTDPSGAFTFIGVPSGSYVLKVVYQPQSTGPSMETINRAIAGGLTVPADVIAEARRTPQSAEPALWAAAGVVASGNDVTGVLLPLREGLHVTGRVEFDGPAPKLDASAFDRMLIALEPVGAQDTSAPRTRVSVTPAATFSQAAVLPGRYFLRVAPITGWTVASIVVDGRDVSDEVVDIASDIDAITITLTDRPTQLSGVVHDAPGSAASRAQVVVFPADATRWSTANAGRRILSAPTSKPGAFTFNGLPPGDYLIVAVPESALQDWQDPARLGALAAGATHVTLRAGEHRTVDLAAPIR